MKVGVFAFAGLMISGACPAMAADWSGPYVGAFLGAGAGHVDFGTTTSFKTLAGNGYFNNQQNADGFASGGDGGSDASLFLAGVDAGSNVEMGSVVLGAVGDLSTFNFGVSRTGTGAYPTSPGVTYAVTTTASAAWLATLRGKVGIKEDNLLFYGTAGLALTDLTVSNSGNDTGSSFLGQLGSSTTQWTFGGAVGAGIDMKLTDKLSLNAEYLYLMFPGVTANGTMQSTVTTNSDSVNTTGNLSAQTVKLGLQFALN